MPLSHPHLMVGFAGLCGLLLVLLLLRSLSSRAGLWSAVLGLLLALTLVSGAAAEQGMSWARPLWWGGWLLLPLLYLPLGTALANIGMQRQFLLFFNALLSLPLLAIGAWVFLQLQWREADPARLLYWSDFVAYALAIPALLWAASYLDAVLQLLRQKRPEQKRRLGLWLLLLLLFAAGHVLDGLAFADYLPQAWGMAALSLAYTILAVAVLIRPGPRRLDGTVPPALIQASRQALLIADGEGRIQAVNDAALKMLGRRRGQVLACDLDDVLDLSVEYLDTATQLHGAGYVERVGIAVKRLNTQREIAVQPLVLRTARGEVLAVICSLSAGSEDPALAVTSLYDPVTGLPGAAMGEALLGQELRRHEGGNGPLIAAVFLRHLDSQIVGEHGQALQERLQAAAAERLQAVCDWPVDLARTTGGAYLMLLTQVNDRQEVLDIAERARDMLSKPYSIDEKSLQPTLVCSVLPDLRVYHDLVDVLADARHGLQQASHRPDAVFVCEERAKDRVTLALALESAIASDALDLKIEPVINLKDERLEGLRVETCWAPEGMAPLEGAALRRLARRVHLEGPLNRWRLRQLAGLKPDKNWTVFLPVDLEDLSMEDYAKSWPASTRLPFRLSLELPHQAWLLPSARKQLAQWRQSGLGLHAADFGPAMISHCADLAPRTAELDAALVQSSDKVAAAAIRGLAGTAAELDAALRAQGVRKIADLQRLRALGVALARGPYFGGVMRPAEFAAWRVAEADLRRRFAGVDPAPGATPRARQRPRLD